MSAYELRENAKSTSCRLWIYKGYAIRDANARETIHPTGLEKESVSSER